MVQKFNVREYVEKVWCPDESRFLRADLQQFYRQVFQYIAKREKAVASRDSADAFKPALEKLLSVIRTKIENHVTGDDVEKTFAGPIGKMLQKKGEYENDRYELPFVKNVVSFLVAHQGYLTTNDLKNFKTAFEAFMKDMYAQVKEQYRG